MEPLASRISQGYDNFWASIRSYHTPSKNAVIRYFSYLEYF